MTNFLDLCQRRRSYRKYTSEPLTDTEIQTILQAGLMAPAGKRQNPWEFVVITDHELLTSLSACRTYGSQMLRTAACGIVVTLDPTKGDTWQCDGAIAAHNLLLAAADLGLGGCWMHVLDRGLEGPEGTDLSAEDTVKQALGIPEHMRVLCIVSLGHKDEERKDYDLAKLQYDKIHYGKY